MMIFIYGLNYKARRENLLELFEQYGTVTSARIIVDPETKRSRGYGFVEMSDEEGAAAIAALNGSIHMRRPIHVEVAVNPPKKRSEKKSVEQAAN
ncbi:MAG: RNA-binding protein [Bacteroidales bacterium]|nr:RNA-binding protein [Bacteroidales bacterium]